MRAPRPRAARRHEAVAAGNSGTCGDATARALGGVRDGVQRDRENSRAESRDALGASMRRADRDLESGSWKLVRPFARVNDDARTGKPLPRRRIARRQLATTPRNRPGAAPSAYPP